MPFCVTPAEGRGTRRRSLSLAPCSRTSSSSIFARRTRVPPAIGMLRRQHPTHGRRDRRRSARTGADARSDARRRDRVPDRAVDRSRAAGGHQPRHHAGRGRLEGTGVRVHRRQGWRRDDDRRGQRRDARWRRSSPARRCSSICTSPTATRRCSSAPSRASRCSTRSRTCIGSTRRSSAAWSDRPERAGAARLVRSRVRRSGGFDEHPSLIDAAARHYPLGRARRAAHRRHRSMRSKPPRGSSSSPTRSLPTVRAATRLSRDAAAALRPDRVAVVISRFDLQAEIGADRRRARARQRRSRTRSRATTGSRSRR